MGVQSTKRFMRFFVLTFGIMFSGTHECFSMEWHCGWDFSFGNISKHGVIGYA